MALLFLLNSWAFCQSSDEFGKVAANFLAFQHIPKTIVSSRLIQANRLVPSGAPVPVAFLANLQGGGFILIAASQDLTPVKAYSPDSDFETLPEAYRTYLLTELEWNIRVTQGARRILDNDPSLSENRQRWKFLLQWQEMRTIQDYTPGTFLLASRWNQSDPYNRFLPQINGVSVPAGCVSVALAQIMRFWGYPQAATGIVSYDWTNPATGSISRLKAVLNRGYNWENMPDSLDSDTPQYKVDEVALLIRDLAIANQTAFGADTSTATPHMEALRNSFGYSTQIATMTNLNGNLFFSTLGAEIDAGRPVLLQFPGHVTAADGYSATGAGKCIHINMGWGGQDNNFYCLDQPVQAGGYTFNTAPPNVTIFYNIKPCTGSDCDTYQEIGDAASGTTITGTFNYDRDVDRYEVYLKGPTMVTGARGYTNQAFFLSIYDCHANLITSDDQPLSADLAPGRYVIRVSPCNDDTSFCYTSPPGYQQYTVTIATAGLTDQERQAADGAANSGPVIGNTFTDLLLSLSGPLPYRILVDGASEDGSAVTLQATTSNSAAVSAHFAKNLLELTPLTTSRVSSRITVTATSDGKGIDKSFIVLVSDEVVAFGKEFQVKGRFDQPNSYNLHSVILDGACVVTGSNGYTNQAFYTSVIDSQQNTVVTPQDTNISHTFSRSRYRIGASLMQNPGEQGPFYALDQGHENYTITALCPDADVRTETIANLLGIDLSGATGTTATVSLDKGWNFVSFPRRPPVATVENQLGVTVIASLRVIWGFDNPSQTWIKFSPSGDANTLSALQQGPGYWIYMDDAETLDISGWTLQPSAAIHLCHGWNLVGYNGGTGAAAEDVLGQGDYWQAIWTWTQGGWAAKVKSNSPPQCLPLPTLFPGKAYWIRYTGSGTDWVQ